MGEIVLCCFFLSGFAGLVLEIVWSRSLALHVGGSAAGVTAVVTAYMAGLGLGSLLVSRWAGRLERPMKAYAALELAVAAFALASPWVLLAPEPLYRLAHDFEEVSWAIPFGVRFAISLALLLIPTAAMGGSLPLLVEDLTRRSGAYASRVALLYGVNTVGAVVGTALAGFVLLPQFGARITLWIAAVVDIAVAVLVLAGPASRRMSFAASLPDAAPRKEPTHGRACPTEPLRTLGMASFALSGGLAMIYELAWTRRLVTLLGSSVYSFTLILATFLAGIGFGSLAARRRADGTHRPAESLATAFMLTGVAALTGTSLLAFFPTAFRGWLAISLDSPARILTGEIVLAAAVLLPAALLLGAIFPLAARLARHDADHPGESAGRAYAINTAGTVVGAAATGLFLLPAFGAVASLRAAALCHLLLGAGLLLLSRGADRRRLVIAGGLCTVFAAIWLTGPLADPYRSNYGLVSLLRDLRRGSHPPSSLEDLERAGQVHPVRLLSVEEGRTATVAVTTSWHLRSLVINGKTDASSDDPTQVLLGQLPLILAGTPRKVLVIGYGSGITTHSVLTHPVEKVETVEIEPAIVRAGRFFSDLNGQDETDPRRVIYFEDGRIHLAYSRQSYDAIISEPSNPWISGVNNLFTSEFFRLVKRRLAPGGVFCQWMHTYELSRESVSSLLCTLLEAFPEAEVYRQRTDLLVVWGRQAAFLTRERLDRAFSSPAVRKDLERVGFQAPEDLLALYLGPLAAVAPEEGRWHPNTDDSGYVEFHAPYDLLSGGDENTCKVPPPRLLGLQRFDPMLPMKEILASFGQAVARREERKRSEDVAEELEAVGARQEAAALRAEIVRFTAVREAADRAGSLRDQSDTAFAAGAFEKSESLLHEALALRPDDPDLLYRYGRVAMKLKRAAAAEQALRRSVEQSRRKLLFGAQIGGPPYQATLSLGILACRLSRFDEGLALFEQARLMNPYQAMAHYYRALTFETLGRSEEARKEVASGLAIDPKDGSLRELDRRLRAGASR